MTDDFSYTPAYKLKEMIENKEVSAYELTNFFLKRIEKINPKLNAFLTINIEKACLHAKKIDESNTSNPLEGIPLVVPDTLDMKGAPTTYGSLLLKDNIPENDETEISILKRAGAIILGKTNIGEFSLSTDTVNQLIGSTLNPWNTDYTPGGPSGGSAVAVAAGLSSVALAADTSGALRMSASFCGLPGLMPTRNRVPIIKTHSVPYSERKYFRKGIIARNIRDIAMMLEVMAKPDERDPLCCKRAEQYQQDLTTFNKPLKIAWQSDFDFLPVDSEVRHTMKQAAKKLEDLGHHVEEFKIGINPDFFTHFSNIVAADRFIMIMSVLEKHPEEYDNLMDITKQVLDIGDQVTGVQYSLGLVYDKWLQESVGQVFKTYDLYLLPTMPIPPYLLNKSPKEIDGKEIHPQLGLWGFTLPFNMTGHPAMTLPAGFSQNGLPIGFQLVGPHFSESNLLKISYQYEQANPSLFDYQKEKLPKGL